MNIKQNTTKFQFPLLTELTGKTFIIKRIKWGEDKSGVYAIVKTVKGDYWTNDKMILDQLLEMEKLLLYVKNVRVKLIKRRHHFIIVPPDAKEK